MGLLEGKVALITGAGGGLGRSHALLMAKEGAKVVVNDLGGTVDGSGNGSQMADGVVDEIRDSGGEATADYGSVTKDADQMVRTALDAYGRLDICVCNAGILRDKSFKNMTPDLWHAVLDVHLNGTYYVAKAAYDQMIEQGDGGRIVVTSSTAGLIGNYGQTNYGAAKAGIAGFMRCLAREGIKYGITVNVLAPAAWSRMTENLMPENAVDRFSPERVSPVVAWLCSDEASDVTGRQFCVGGNRVSMLSWQVDVLAEREPKEAPWEPSEIGNQLRNTMDRWPKPLGPMDV